jgi:hypothetical protein
MSTSGNDCFVGLPEAATFTVTRMTPADGAAMSLEQLSGITGVPGGKNISPQLSWSGARWWATPRPCGTDRHRRDPRLRLLALAPRHIVRTTRV